MTLTPDFLFRQLLSAAAAVFCGVFALVTMQADALAQTPPGPDSITLRTTPPQFKSGVLITGVVGGRIMVREGTSDAGYDISQVQEVLKAAPAEFTSGLKLVEEGKLEQALPLIRTVADKYRGLPTTWARDSAAMLGNICITLGKLTEAEMAIREFKSAYAATASAAANVAEARLAAGRSQFDKAKGIAEPIASGALQKKNVSRTDSQTYGQAFLVLGQCAENENKLPEAMEHYCRAVAIFYQEPAIVADAQKRIDELRKKGVTTP